TTPEPRLRGLQALAIRWGSRSITPSGGSGRPTPPTLCIALLVAAGEQEDLHRIFALSAYPYKSFATPTAAIAVALPLRYAILDGKIVHLDAYGKNRRTPSCSPAPTRRGPERKVATLEDWFDPRRLCDDYVPTGFKPYGVDMRAVKGHEFGLDLSATDKVA